MAKMTEAALNGEEYKPQGEAVYDYPQAFKDWCKDNEEQIYARWSEGKANPYFIEHNQEVFGKILKGYDFEQDKPNVADVPQAESQTDVPQFIPATTIEEAQAFAQQYVEKYRLDKTFKGSVDYKGIDLDMANEINQALQQIFDGTDVAKISGIKAVSPTSAQGRKAFPSGTGSIASYDPISRGIFLNKEILGSKEKFDAHMKKSPEAFEYLQKNYDKLSASQKAIFDRYKISGRELVDSSVKGCITHELGHHIEWTMPTKLNNEVGRQRVQYANAISGYAGSSKSEYIAESFATYIRGEKDKVDPAFANYLDEMMGGLHKKGEAAKGSSRTETRRVLNNIISEDYKGRTRLSDEQDRNLRAVCEKLKIDYDKVKPMTFLDADSGNTNPNRGNSTYNDNCVPCVFANEMRRRGIDVITNMMNNDLAEDFLRFRLTTKDEKPTLLTNPQKIDYSTEEKTFTKLKNLMNVPNGRYAVGWSGRYPELGHLLCAERIGDEIVFYGPQLNKNIHSNPVILVLFPSVLQIHSQGCLHTPISFRNILFYS